LILLIASGNRSTVMMPCAVAKSLPITESICFAFSSKVTTSALAEDLKIINMVFLPFVSKRKTSFAANIGRK